MQWKKVIKILCLVAYMVAFAHTVVPHEYHVHHSSQTCSHECEHGHHHNHLPHHSCDQLSSIYDFTGCQDHVQAPLSEIIVPVMVPECLTPADISEMTVSHEMDAAPPPLPAHGSVTGFRAPPAA